MKLYPTLRYADAHAAIQWLQDALGFEKHEVYDDDAGGVAHAQLRWGDGMIMLGSEREGDSFGSRKGKGWLYASCDDPDALFARATAAGAEVARELQDTDYGSREFTIRDLEGNTWSFGTYEP